MSSIIIPPPPLISSSFQNDHDINLVKNRSMNKLNVNLLRKEATFSQVPYVRIYERLEKSTRVRKQMKRFMKNDSSFMKELHNSYQNDLTCISAMQNDEINDPCIVEVLEKLKIYHDRISQEALQTSQQFQSISQIFSNSSRIRKWNNSASNYVQKGAQDVQAADKKMEKAISRKDKAVEELNHWNRVFEANKSMQQAQPTNPECQRSVQFAASKLQSANDEHNAAFELYQSSIGILQTSIAKRDELVTLATEYSQAVEEDRLHNMLQAIKKMVKSKQQLVKNMQLGLSELEQSLDKVVVAHTIQSFINENSHQNLTHRESKVVRLLEWQYRWDKEQVQEKNDLNEYVTSSRGTEKDKQIKSYDLEVMKCFVGGCFSSPAQSLAVKKLSSRNRSRFYDNDAIGLYRLENVRKIILSCLNTQRSFSQELSTTGLETLSSALNIFLDACQEANDTKSAKNVMNISQTFYCLQNEKQLYLQKKLRSHPIWSKAHFWGDALLLGIGEELSKSPQTCPWYHLSPENRVETVIQVHNVVYGQIGTLIYNMCAFGVSNEQINIFVVSIASSFDLSESLFLNLISSVNNLPEDEVDNSVRIGGEDVAMFAVSLIPEERKSEKKNSAIKFISTLNPFSMFKTSSSSKDLKTGCDTRNSTSYSPKWKENRSKSLSPQKEIRNAPLKNETGSIVESNDRVVPKSNLKSSNSWQDLFGAVKADEISKKNVNHCVKPQQIENVFNEVSDCNLHKFNEAETLAIMVRNNPQEKPMEALSVNKDIPQDVVSVPSPIRYNTPYNDILTDAVKSNAEVLQINTTQIEEHKFDSKPKNLPSLKARSQSCKGLTANVPIILKNRQSTSRLIDDSHKTVNMDVEKSNDTAGVAALRARFEKKKS